MTELQELLDACIRQEIFPGLKDELEQLKVRDKDGKLSPATRGLLIRKLKQVIEKNGRQIQPSSAGRDIHAVACRHGAVLRETQEKKDRAKD